MKTLPQRRKSAVTSILLAMAVLISSLALPSLSVEAAAKTQVITTTQECSIWSVPNTSEQNRVKKVPAGYQITVYTDIVKSTKGDGKTFYKTLKGAYILCKYCSGSGTTSAAPVTTLTLQSTGNTVLDAKVKELLTYLNTKNLSRDELLKAAYNYLVVNGSYDSMASFYFDPSPLFSGGEISQEIATAYSFFCQYKGDCYDFSNAFIAIAKALGYNAYGVRGVCASSSSKTGWTNHGWACIYMDGTEYVYDPQLDNRVYTSKKKNTYSYYARTYKSLNGKYMQYDTYSMFLLFGDPVYSPWLTYTVFQATPCDASYDNRQVVYL